MPKLATRSIFNHFGLALISATFACAQATTSFTAPISSGNESWESAQSLGSAKHKLIVITLDEPDHRQTCHVRSFTQEKLVCSRAFGASRTYQSKQVAAIILPEEDDLRIPLFVMFNGVTGLAIWGTVVLSATCPVCAAGTAIVSVIFSVFSGVNVFADGTPGRTIYLAPGQRLTGKLRPIQLQTLAGVN